MEQYPRWEEMRIYVDRIELTADTDFPTCIGHAKCLIEGVGKEICEWQEKELPNNPDINKVIRSAFQALDIAGGHYLVDIAKALTTIGQRVGELRNSIDLSAHGKPLEELRSIQQATHDYTADFMMTSADLVASFLIETFKRYRLEKDNEEEPEPLYLDAEDFNEFFDGEHGEVTFSDYAYQPSEILFHVDRQAYNSERGTYYATINIEGEEE